MVQLSASRSAVPQALDRSAERQSPAASSKEAQHAQDTLQRQLLSSQAATSKLQVSLSEILLKALL